MCATEVSQMRNHHLRMNSEVLDEIKRDHVFNFTTTDVEMEGLIFAVVYEAAITKLHIKCHRCHV